MSDDKKITATVERSHEWETPHGLVRLSVDTVRRYFCPEASEQEVMHFLAICKYHKLNPWLKEAYLIKFGTSPATLVVGKDFFVRRANTYPQFGGFQAGITVLRKQADGSMQLDRREGELVLEGDQLVGGWADVHRKGVEHPFRAEVSFKEYCKTKEGKPFKTWAEMPGTMIRKVALVHALREAFPEEFQGLYDEEEIQGRPAAIEIEMPKSQAEAAVAPAAPDNGDPQTPPPNGPKAPPSPREDLWSLLLERFGGPMGATKKLKELSGGKVNVATLDDEEVKKVLEKLQAVAG